MRDALRRLEAAGATRIAIPCNTAHHWHAALQAGTPLPILHIVDAVADTLAGPPGAAIGVLATSGTVRAGIYQSRLGLRGYACRIPDDAAQAEVMRAIRLVKAGRLPEATAILRREAEALAAAGCREVVMACTEIPVALAAADGPVRAGLVDATEALARSCVAACRPEAAPVAA
jgi:aspartate racemase